MLVYLYYIKGYTVLAGILATSSSTPVRVIEEWVFKTLHKNLVRVVVQVGEIYSLAAISCLA